jgi:hypothetical protein
MQRPVLREHSVCTRALRGRRHHQDRAMLELIVLLCLELGGRS